MMQHELLVAQSPRQVSFGNDLFGRGQIRLAQLSVYNWGSFQGLHCAKFHPKGTLVTGDNGAGKSTFIDGLMALLQPVGKASFNVAAAQGDRSDRSLISYMRGSFGSVHDGSSTRTKSKREKAVVTGLHALYQADDGSKISLVALFWTLQASNSLSDVKRCYLVARGDLSLKSVLDAFDEGDVRKFKQWLKLKPEVICCDDRFNEYQELYREYLCMDNKNAPALLSRALGLKKIDDLTKLIREMVLEPSNIREEVRQIVDEFKDLVVIHNRLVDAREQVNHLQKLPTVAGEIDALTEQYQQLYAQKLGLAVYFAKQKSTLLTQKITQLEQEYHSLKQKRDDNETCIRDAEELSQRRHAEYLQLGGEKIELLKKDITHTETNLQRVVLKSAEYQKQCQVLSLDPVLSKDIFIKNQQLAIEYHANNIAQKDKMLNQWAIHKNHQEQLQKQLIAIGDEIQEIVARPDSNISANYQRLRNRLQQELNFADKELMFVGEMLEVKESERHWQGAIERALGGRKMTLLVPQTRYAEVTYWLNHHHTGLFVRVQVVHLVADKTDFDEQGFLSKLLWREHPYQAWLKQYLNKLDLTCVGSVDELNLTPFSLTQEGLMHLQQGYFEKKDQIAIHDRSQWQLGFSNQSKLTLLQETQKHLKDELSSVIALTDQTYKAMEDIDKKTKQLEQIASYQWQEIDAPYWQQKSDNLKQELEFLQSKAVDLSQALQRWELSKQELAQLHQQAHKLSVAIGSCQSKQEEAKEQYNQNNILAQSSLEDDIHALLTKRVGAVSLDDTMQQSHVDKQLDGELNQIHQKITHQESKAVSIMSGFRGKEKWKALAVDWEVGLKGLSSFLVYLDKLQTEGLPALVEQFQERLNKHTTQSLARLQNQLENERDKIKDRISRINLVLAKTEFRQGTFLRLQPKPEKFPHVQAFEKNLKEALGLLTQNNHEQRFYLLQEIVSTLEKASDKQTATTLESLRLLDPRYQMAFLAEEISQSTAKPVDVLSSSSGKSGGEKESFAGMIVAASLAYVLTPDDGDRPVYCTVFLDEAFSNTAESVSRRVLRVFQELHIHVNLITPFKNLNLARESAKSLLIAERDVDRHESRLCEITWEELDRQQASRQQSKLEQYNVEILA